MTFKNIKCDYCNKDFKRTISHINQNKKRGNKNYCSGLCIGKSRSGKNNPMYGISSILAPMFGVHRYGKNVPMFGNKHTDITKRLMSLNHANVSGKNHPMFGKKRPEHSKRMSGRNNPNYKDGDSLKNEIERGSNRNGKFVQEMLKRDNYTCQICNDDKGGNLECDHIMPWALYPKLRYVADNCRTLCRPCHVKYGAKPNAAPKKWATTPVVNEMTL